MFQRNECRSFSLINNIVFFFLLTLKKSLTTVVNALMKVRIQTLFWRDKFNRSTQCQWTFGEILLTKTEKKGDSRKWFLWRLRTEFYQIPRSSAECDGFSSFIFFMKSPALVIQSLIESVFLELLYIFRN